MKRWLPVLAIIAGVGSGVYSARAQFPPYDPSRPIIRNFETPPAPVLSPEEELKTIKIAPGFRLELLAQEPLVADPVTMVFDPDGRAYVAEMRSYMPDADGKGDEAPTGTVAAPSATGVLGDGQGTEGRDARNESTGPRSFAWRTLARISSLSPSSPLGTRPKTRAWISAMRLRMSAMIRPTRLSAGKDMVPSGEGVQDMKQE